MTDLQGTLAEITLARSEVLHALEGVARTYPALVRFHRTAMSAAFNALIKDLQRQGSEDIVVAEPDESLPVSRGTTSGELLVLQAMSEEEDPNAVL